MKGERLTPRNLEFGSCEGQRGECKLNLSDQFKFISNQLKQFTRRKLSTAIRQARDDTTHDLFWTMKMVSRGLCWFARLVYCMSQDIILRHVS